MVWAVLVAVLAFAAPPDASVVARAAQLHLDGDSAAAAELLLPLVADGGAAHAEASLALGRVAFANGRWLLAEAAYHRVPFRHELGQRSRLEATWAAWYAEPGSPWRAWARALWLYREDPGDPELRYLIGALAVEACGVPYSDDPVAALREELRDDATRPPDAFPTARDAEILAMELIGSTGDVDYPPPCWQLWEEAPDGLLAAIQLVLSGREPAGPADRRGLRWVRSHRAEVRGR